MQPVFRFAPSPNGPLHLGHAYSALLNEKLAREAGGRLLLRIEDIDKARCTAEKTQGVRDDLSWLGIRFEAAVLCQSTEMPRYAAALAVLEQRGLLFKCTCSRTDIAARLSRETQDWPRDPDGSPVYPGTCRSAQTDAARKPFAWRLDMKRAIQALKCRPLEWLEIGRGMVPADPFGWGDVVLARKDTPTSYHLAVVLDDALQGVTDVVRGKDLFEATAVHRVLQELLELPAPQYHHHALLLDEQGQKLAKSRASTRCGNCAPKALALRISGKDWGFRPLRERDGNFRAMYCGVGVQMALVGPSTPAY